MNQLYRLLHTPPACLIKTLAGWKETYAIALRPVPTAPGCDPLPALGQGRYTCLPGTPGHWYTDPQLFARAGERWLFCEDFDLAANKGAIAALPLPADGRPGEPRTLLQGESHLTFPTVFEWNGEVWLIPGTGEDRTLCLYRCRRFPDDWELSRSFPVGMELAGTILLDAAPEALTLLSAQRQPEGGPAARLRPGRRGRVRPGGGRALRAGTPGLWPGCLQCRAAFLLGRAADPPGPGRHPGAGGCLPAVLGAAGRPGDPAVRGHAPQHRGGGGGPLGAARHPELLPGRTAGGPGDPLPGAAALTAKRRKNHAYHCDPPPVLRRIRPAGRL